MEKLREIDFVKQKIVKNFETITSKIVRQEELYNMVFAMCNSMPFKKTSLYIFDHQSYWITK